MKRSVAECEIDQLTPWVEHKGCPGWRRQWYAKWDWSSSRRRVCLQPCLWPEMDDYVPGPAIYAAQATWNARMATAWAHEPTWRTARMPQPNYNMGPSTRYGANAGIYAALATNGAAYTRLRRAVAKAQRRLTAAKEIA